MALSLKEMEPSIPAEAAQALFKASNGNVNMQTRLGLRGWERSLYCDDCSARQSVESLILLEKDDDRAFARILQFCAQHRHDSHFKMAEKTGMETVKLETGRRVKEI